MAFEKLGTIVITAIPKPTPSHETAGALRLSSHL
jgi:hypothetical protein